MKHSETTHGYVVLVPGIGQRVVYAVDANHAKQLAIMKYPISNPDPSAFIVLRKIQGT